ncbi:hypothetical protein KOW79_012780 [Hemibagrus wyckioides]|uniref:Uncharacterized protein n=1 Tax=Hemibagrus wyckioides TaxID=337641 RepID=A0A9D3NHP3_9TELE|nr:hypothetical protein KOW79_012780 [Hemibagrus wyckioides]
MSLESSCWRLVKQLLYNKTTQEFAWSEFLFRPDRISVWCLSPCTILIVSVYADKKQRKSMKIGGQPGLISVMREPAAHDE